MNDQSVKLFKAVETSDPITLCQLLSDPKVDIDARDHDNRTPLSKAVLRGNIKIIQTLLRHGADIGSIEQQPWILGYCLYLENELLLEDLILAGLDIKTETIDYNAMICENYQDPEKAEEIINRLSTLQEQLTDEMQSILGEVPNTSCILRLLPKLKKQNSTPDIEVLIKEHGITIELAEKLYKNLSDPNSRLSYFHQKCLDGPLVFSKSFTTSLRP